MAKKSPAQQPSLYTQSIPTMQQGYYSSGPNPNLCRFIEEHSKPYVSATDDYNIPPFDHPISSNKSSSIYNMHPYWSKKPYEAIRQYIRHYTKPGDLVLDPFCGSGSTALASLAENCAAIAIDLSPAATFITQSYCTPLDIIEAENAISGLVRQVAKEVAWLYETRCDRCNGRATIAYTVYSQVLQCPRCLEMVPLFDCIQISGLTDSGKPKKLWVCPVCHKNGHTEEVTTRGKRFGSIPVMVAYDCEEGCKPKRIERTHNNSDKEKREFFQNYDLAQIRIIESKELPYWYPEANLVDYIPYRMLIKRDFRLEEASKLTDFFTRRNLWVLSTILHHANDNQLLRLIIQSSIMASSKRAQHLEEGGGYIPGTYHLPAMYKERNVLGVFDRIASKMLKARKEITTLLQSTRLLISTQSATNLKSITDDSIDYIFTDPPYSGSIQFGELNFLWEAWMRFQTDYYSDEVIVNEARKKTESDWYKLLKQAMEECYRVLKPGRWLSLCYHDTSEGTWQLLQDLMAEVGFVSEMLETALYIDTGGKTYNQYTADKVTKRDLVINFRKPRPGELNQFAFLEHEEQATFAEKAQAILTEALQVHPGVTADRLYDILVSRLVRRGEFERHNFEALLTRVAEPVGQPGNASNKTPVRWYLRATADQIDEAESAKEAAAAERLERYMVKYLTQKPEESGIHYSDLFEQYLPIGDKPRRLLQEWLPEFFFKTTEGTWRPPLTEEEREQKAALRTSGALRRIKRFARALLEGVPPAPHDHPANAATAADWIRQCRRAGLYELGRVIYEKGGFAFGVLSEEAQLEVEEDYQLCVRRM